MVSIDTPQFTGRPARRQQRGLLERRETARPASTRPPEASTSTTSAIPSTPVTLDPDAGDNPSGPVFALARANSYHSVFVWQDGNESLPRRPPTTPSSEDVDIFDITDPTAHRRPDQGLASRVRFPHPRRVSPTATTIFHHDVVVKEIGGVMRMLVSYWDAGYVQLERRRPGATRRYITDTDFDDPDPLTGLDPPEGNAHQARVLARQRVHPGRGRGLRARIGVNDRVDHDGRRTRATSRRAAVGGSAPLAELPDAVLNGPTVYGGYGCDGSAPIPARAGAGLPRLSRRARRRSSSCSAGRRRTTRQRPETACFPGEKAENGDRRRL